MLSSPGSNIRLYGKEKIYVSENRLDFVIEHIDFTNKKIFFSEHHLSHAASAFYPSPFNRAAVLTIDGVGEWSTTSISEGNGNELNKIKEINFFDHFQGKIQY